MTPIFTVSCAGAAIGQLSPRASASAAAVRATMESSRCSFLPEPALRWLCLLVDLYSCSVASQECGAVGVGLDHRKVARRRRHVVGRNNAVRASGSQETPMTRKSLEDLLQETDNTVDMLRN